MSVHVIATAGHVDHGKSTLVRALTGIEPDRWAEEKRRGLTIDLGFAWTTTPSGREIAFVDVPGHERFLGNMLAGLGPAPVVCFVVAADEGWREQSTDHRDAVAALGIRHGVIVVTRADKAPDAVEDVIAQARKQLRDTGLADAPAVAVSAVTGAGLDELRHTLDEVLATVPAPVQDGRVRLWVDRAFTIKGAGAVVTGTLAAGRIRAEDTLELSGAEGTQRVVVRGLQHHGSTEQVAQPVSRTAVNLRGIQAAAIHRGDALLTPGAWQLADTVDVRRVSGAVCTDVPAQVTAHIGTAAVPARLRPFGDDHARLTFDRRLPLAVSDRIVLRDSGSGRVLGGAQVLDADPPELRRRGDGARRAEALSALPPGGDVTAEVVRRGAVQVATLRRLGIAGATGDAPEGVRAIGGWWVDERRFAQWTSALQSAVWELHARDPLAAGLSRGAATSLLALPSTDLLATVVEAAGLQQRDGEISAPGAESALGAAEDAVRQLETRLRARPFDAPEADDLAQLGLGPRELAAAERADRLLRLRDGVILLPNAPALAMRALASLPALFTTSEARQALQATRRVAIPLLEHLDARGWTRRVDNSHREVVR
nr:selenocysteine-specific translation elongation factor [Flexivirga meconopsidis]